MTFSKVSNQRPDGVPYRLCIITCFPVINNPRLPADNQAADTSEQIRPRSRNKSLTFHTPQNTSAAAAVYAHIHDKNINRNTQDRLGVCRVVMGDFSKTFKSKSL